MASISKALAALLPLTAAFAAATPTAYGTFEIVTLNPELRIVGMLALLVSVTAITFIVVLLACGMREPVL